MQTRYRVGFNEEEIKNLYKAAKKNKTTPGAYIKIILKKQKVI